jgi:hypothetical protein
MAEEALEEEEWLATAAKVFLALAVVAVGRLGTTILDFSACRGLSLSVGSPTEISYVQSHFFASNPIDKGVISKL